METVTIRPAFIVGMYQQSRRQSLDVGSIYNCKREPTNPYDRNAVAVFDGPKRVAYIRRDCAIHLTNIMRNVPMDVQVKPEREPKYTVKGPEQFCTIVATIRKCNKDKVLSEISKTPLYVSKS